MELRTAYTRRQEKSSRRQKRLGTLAVFGVTASVAAFLTPELAASHDERLASSAGLTLAAAPVLAASATVAEGAAAPRRVYPYSIIPGGVSGVEELKRVIRADRVVAAHYANFDTDKAREVIVTKPRAVYVSYRKGDQVFWTAKKLMLAQGETLLSDGTNEMRARCANRISDTPRFPVEAHGPSEAELDTVVAAATGEEGMFLAASAGLDPDGGGSGSRYPLGYFPDGAGLVQPASALANLRSPMPSLPQPDRSSLYGVGSGSRTSRIAQSSAAQGDDTAAPGVGSSSGGTTGSGSGDDTVQMPGDSNTPAAGGSGRPDNGDPSTTPGTGDPATPGSGGDGPGDSGDSGTGNPPSTPTPTPTPTPESGPELPPQGPATPGTPLPPTAGDVELPATPVEVPEPGTLWLSSAAIAMMLWLRRKGHRAQS